MQKSGIINFNSILELSNQLYQSINTEFILNSTLLSLMGKLLINKAIIFYKNQETNDYEILIKKGNLDLNHINNENYSEFKIITENDKYLYENKIRFLIPIKIDEEIVAIFLLGKSLIEHNLTNEEILYINLVSNICGNALKNAINIKNYIQAKERAERHNQLLKTLFEIGRDFSTFINREQIIKNLSLNLMGQLATSRFSIYLFENGNLIEIVNRLNCNFSDDILKNFYQYEIAQVISNDILEKYPFLRNEIEIIAPMKVKGEKKGLLLIGPKLSKNPYSKNDILFIEAIGNTAIAALENERLIKEEIEKKKIESELNIALEIQKNLLPKTIPTLKNFDIWGLTIPSRYVGGDYFDFIKINEGKYLIIIADVSGKGIPASLIMSNLQAILNILAVTVDSLLEIVDKTNQILCKNTAYDKFVTVFFALIDDNELTLEYINAGHNYPILITDNRIKKLEKGGLLLGFIENPPLYTCEKITLKQNDTIVLFTDGINEAKNKLNEEYSDERLENIIFENSNLQSEELCNLIVKDVKSFSQDCEQFDDITLITIKFK